MLKRLLFSLLFLTSSSAIIGQSIAREWNEEVLNAIRNDFARPTVHARNLFHTSVAMYDIWTVFDDRSEAFFLGKQWDNYINDFRGFETTESKNAAIHEAISYAVYRLIQHRFSEAPGYADIQLAIDAKMEVLGYEITYTSTNYSTGDPAALGNYVAAQLIDFGLQDGSNESNDYANRFYEPYNPVLNTDFSGNPSIIDPNRWQPLRIENFVDQSGNSIPGGTPEFLSPEWGEVTPFSLQEDDLEIRERDGYAYHLYHDPGNPWKLQDSLGLSDPYKWGFAMVAVWGSHLSSEDMTRIDISPRSAGNLSFDAMPQYFVEYQSFYKFYEGGDISEGRALNPITGLPYQSQMVKRGDYTRVLAEFWADGPDSETPPGHWFTILNYVNDQPELERKLKGGGRTLSALEWDIKSYFALGGALHDAAIAAWSCKGYYDYVRPMSAIRYMADRGQSTDPSEPNYHPYGIPLVPGYIELVTENDPLVGPFQGNLNKIKLFTWKGPDYIVDPLSDEAGVDWILAEDWFPYQRPSFVTPPFAGYVSGHSTFSRAAAEVLTELTGNEYFPGGLGIFEIEADEFLIFEDGPSENFRLEWATYRDASDQTSLSRIWGGIHPPIDDIPGRIMGEKIGRRAVAKAIDYFNGKVTAKGILYPNPAESEVVLMYDTQEDATLQIIDLTGRVVLQLPAKFDDSDRYYFSVDLLNIGMYVVQLFDEQHNILFKQKLIVK